MNKTVPVSIQGSHAAAEVLGGAPLLDEHAQSFRALSPRKLPEAALRKLHGRGPVEVGAYSSARNGYRLVFEIEVLRTGSGRYEVQIGW